MAARCGDRRTIQLLTIFVFHEGNLLCDYRRHSIELIIV